EPRCAGGGVPREQLLFSRDRRLAAPAGRGHGEDPRGRLLPALARRAGPGARGIGRPGSRPGRRVVRVRRQPVEFLRARLLALYLLSLAAVDGSLVAWQADLSGRWGLLLLPPVVLGAATLAGAAIHDRLSAMLDRHLRARLRSGTGIVYGGALFLVCMGLLLGHRDAAEGGPLILQGLQVGFLLLAGFGRGYSGAILNAFVLTSTSVLAGGPGAAISVTLHGGLVVFFLIADRSARLLTEYPVETLPRSGPILARGLLQAALVAGALAAWFWFVPAAPYAPLQRAGAIPPVSVDRIAGLMG